MKHRRQTLATLLLVAVTLPACDDANDDSTADSNQQDDPWANYEIPPPEGDVLATLNQSPFIYPRRVCVPADSIADLPADAELEAAEDGTMQLCVWDLFSGNVPEGLRWSDVMGCEGPFTQGPSWFTPPARVHESPDTLLEDAAYVAELDWVQGQIEASGCGCCHASALGSGHTSGFDVSAPAVWTDTMTNAQLAMAAGMFDEHQMFGWIEPEQNHGFDRRSTLFASTDPERLAAFFTGELDRRGGNEDDLAEAQGQFDALFGALLVEPAECIAPFEGIQDGRIVWNGNPVRQIYVLEEGSASPAFPPNLDRPEGTVWAVYVDNDGEPIESGTVAVGEVPSGARQVVPEDGTAPPLVQGRTYRLFATGDIMSRRSANCTFVY